MRHKKPKIEWGMVGDPKFDMPNLYPISNELYRSKLDYFYFFQINNIVYKLFAPAGTLIDGNSVPKYGRMFINRDGVIRLAAFIHDLLYRIKGGLSNEHLGITLEYKAPCSKTWFPVAISREWCDELYEHIGLQYTKLKKERRGVRFSRFALRVGGKKHFGSSVPPAVRKMKRKDKELLGLL